MRGRSVSSEKLFTVVTVEGGTDRLRIGVGLVKTAEKTFCSRVGIHRRIHLECNREVIRQTHRQRAHHRPGHKTPIISSTIPDPRSPKRGTSARRRTSKKIYIRKVTTVLLSKINNTQAEMNSSQS